MLDLILEILELVFCVLDVAFSFGNKSEAARESRANRLARIRAMRKRRAVWRWKRKGKRRGGLPDIGLHCLRCEYLLTGLTEPRCPECGEPFGPKSIEIPPRIGKVTRMRRRS